MASGAGSSGATSGGARTPRVVLVGHCGPDAAMLASAVRRAHPGVEVASVESDRQLATELPRADLLLVNRALDGEFRAADGVELIRGVRATGGSDGRPAAMLISNFEEAQARARLAGAVPGFGKSAVNTPEAARALRAQLGGG